MAWTREEEAELRKLWDAGWSGGQIAKKTNHTKNAVIGKARRLGLAERESPIKRNIEARRNKQRSEPQLKAPEELAAIEPLIPGPPAKSCQWIEGEPSADDSCKCGAPVVPGRSYCAEHLKRTIIPESRKLAA